ncbi:DNA polymerase I [Candidatus Dojkabacteria bacterium]|nr:DNA polymerase I [Candidatus Dojkabacteria bacterium]
MKSKKKFVLIDSNALIHRAYHAYPKELSTSRGELTNATYGFSVILLKVIDELKPDYLVCVYDVPGVTIRHKKYKEYKATRKPLEEDLKTQIPKTKEVVEAFDIPILEKRGYEADDVIGTLENDLKARNLEKIIVTGDQDIFQLVDLDTQVYLAGRNFKDSQLFGPLEVYKKVGLKPNQIVDYKALCGDPSDNIPGVSGIGKKGAVNLLERFGSLDNIYRNIQKVEGRYRNRLEEGKDIAYLSRDLAEIVKDISLSYEIKKCKWGKFNADKVKKVFQRFEFLSLLRRLDKMQEGSGVVMTDIKQATSDKKALDVSLLKNDKQILSFINKLKKEKTFSLALTVSRRCIVEALPSLLSFSWDESKVYCIGVDSVYDGANLTVHGKKIRSILENGSYLKVGYDIKSSIHALRNIGIELKGKFFDIQLAAFLAQAGYGSVAFKDLAFNYLGAVFDQDKNGQIEITDSDTSCVSKEAQVILKLFKILEKKLEESSKGGEWNLKKLFSLIEMPLIPVLSKMEFNGILIDRKYLENFGLMIDKDLKDVQKDAYKLVGHEFNLNSPKQVSEILFEELNLPKPKKTKSGGYSTGVGILNELTEVHPVINKILQYRELSKIRSTYTTSLLDAVNSKTKRIHTTYNQAVTATGRLSSTEPNLQNIPISSDLGRRVRRAFVSGLESSFISFDYSQQELRILAHLAHERNLIDAFEKGVDVHLLTASKIFKKSMDKITKRERGIGKTINFAVMYGMGPHGLSNSLKISFSEACEFIEKYFDEYSSVREYFDGYLSKCKDKGYAETIFGRRRMARGLVSLNRTVQGAATRELINFPIQGSAADMMKLAMVKVFEMIQKEFPKKARMLLQIHDELVFEYKGELGKVGLKKKVKDIMENVYPLEVPLKVDIYEGKNLEEVH